MTGKLSFSAFRHAWLDQVAGDASLPPMAFKLAWYFMKDCGRTLSKQGGVFSFRGQEGYAGLLGITARHVRDLFAALRGREHIQVKRGGKGHPNSTFPVLFDRHDSAGQNDALTGTIVPFDRNSDDILIGPKVPGILLEENRRGDSGASSKARPPDESRASSEGQSSTLEVLGQEVDAARSAPDGALAAPLTAAEESANRGFVRIAGYHVRTMQKMTDAEFQDLEDVLRDEGKLDHPAVATLMQDERQRRAQLRGGA